MQRLFSIVIFYCLLFSYSFANPEQDLVKKLDIKIFQYDDLRQKKDEMKAYMHEYGFVAIRGVPEFVKKRENYLRMAQEFVLTDDDLKSSVSAVEGGSIAGWTRGKEKFRGQVDAYKGSYYAFIKSHEEQNIWPSQQLWSQAEEFKRAYIELADLMFNTGREVLSIIGLEFDKLSATGRMLHYASVQEGDESNNPYWCGMHRDHGLFTGLISSAYKKDGKIVPEPSGAGLYIRDKKVKIPADILVFQVGETSDLITNHDIVATDHYVKKAPSGFERFTFALFFDLDDDYKIYTNNVDPQCQSRYQYGMTYKEWCRKSIDRYKVEKIN